MNALNDEREERVRAEDAVEIIDCGRASERTKGGSMILMFEGGYPPFSFWTP